MKKEQYLRLLEKFDQGDSSVSEEKMLKSVGQLSKETEVYFDYLKSEKSQKSSLEFAKFQKMLDQPSKSVSTKNTIGLRWIGLAASLIFICTLAFLFFPETNTSKPAPDVASAQVYKSEKTEILKENSYLSEPEKIAENKVRITKNEDILDDVLPKKSRMKRKVIKRYVKNDTPYKEKNIVQYESDFVTINGHKITNEKDAINVAKYSFQILANNVNQTVEQADVRNALNMEN